jgi:hypothetical protein
MKEMFYTVVRILRIVLLVAIVLILIGILDFISNPLKYIRSLIPLLSELEVHQVLWFDLKYTG